MAKIRRSTKSKNPKSEKKENKAAKAGKETKRARAAFKGLEKRFYSKLKQPLVDYDYINKLSDEEKEFLNKFTSEFIGANFTDEGKPIHKTKKQRKEIYNNNNSRNRCIYSNHLAMGKVITLNNTTDEDIHNATVNYEDLLIDLIDANRRDRNEDN